MGCLKALVVQVGCLLLLVAAAVLAFLYRKPLWDAYHRWRGGKPPAAAAYAAPPSDAASARRASDALARLARAGGPAYVDLTAADVAALLDRDLVRGSGRVFDSVSVALDSNTVLVKGLLDLSRLPHDFLGPFSGSFNGREPVEAGGALLTGSAGTLRWVPDRLRIRDFPIPKKGIPVLLRSLHVDAAQGGVTLPGVTGVGDVRVTPDRVRLYRLERR
jgi:hypothetical protein